MTLDQCSRLNPFISGFEVARPNHLINNVVLPLSSIFDSLALLDFDQFLGRTLPTLSETGQTLAISSCTHFHGHSPELFHLLSIELGLLLCRNLERRHSTQILNRSDRPCLHCIISSGCLKVVIHHASKLSSSEESILFLSSLLFNTDSSSERGTGDDSSQRRRNLRI